ncbi:hypothetical protein BES34_015730 [Leptospira inadai serovar Lyme]|uniref:Uncharacterized protein n=1 Tax=Leptospira inadai serovar Lyme TaxID=293084 RepID=A0ABX4YFH3_9LEPT|nr:hypothetical protein BES34_015730 [Leptospira inadai serovar Lyme]
MYFHAQIHTLLVFLIERDSPERERKSILSERKTFLSTRLFGESSSNFTSKSLHEKKIGSEFRSYIKYIEFSLN